MGDQLAYARMIDLMDTNGEQLIIRCDTLYGTSATTMKPYQIVHR